MAGALALLAVPLCPAQTSRYLLDVPDYEWDSGCFGTGAGILFGFYDRTGMPDFYTGPTGDGLAPMDNRGTNYGIRSMWVTKATMDGRPADQPGHVDDYYIDLWSGADDPYVTAGRGEHVADCIGDFIGMNQKKWTNMNDECDGNIDATAFMYWDKGGLLRVNYQPTNDFGEPVPDMQSGLRSWARSRGYEVEVFSQLTDFNTTVPAGRGFTFADLKREIDAGYPVLFWIQHFAVYNRSVPGMPRGNPPIHGVVAYGYEITESGQNVVRYRDGWAGGADLFSEWSAESSWSSGAGGLRGVLGCHPKPKITHLEREGTTFTIRWDGPSASLYDVVTGTTNRVHRYIVERSTTLDPFGFSQVGAPTTEREFTYDQTSSPPALFFRVRLETP